MRTIGGLTRVRLAVVVGFVGLYAAVAGQVETGGDARYDLVIRSGRVLDGTGTPWFRADVAVRGDRIVAVGKLSVAGAAAVIDASGLYVAPGFIDTHTHAGPGLATEALSAARPMLAQGITTVFVNPDGGGRLDISAQRADFERARPAVNIAQLVPHGSVRGKVMGMAGRLATDADLALMRQVVRRGMEEGAWGLSSGPFYAPGSFSDTRELVELAKVAGDFGGVYQSHVRDESDYEAGVLAAVDEVVAVAREARLPAVVTHVKALGPAVWGFGAAIAFRIEQARAEGIEVWADHYPYEASGTSLAAALVPRWAQAGGGRAMRDRLADPAARAKVRAEMAKNLQRRAGAARIQFRRVRFDPVLEGQTLEQVALARKQDPVDTALDLIEREDVAVVSFAMHEDDVRLLMAQPWTMTASDGDLVPFGEGVPHPRSYGTFARKLRRYVVEQRVLSVEEAVRTMTSLPARVFRMSGRGELRAGAFADLVVFDLARVRDTATYTKPHQLAEGVAHVLVNGRLAVRDGAFTDERAGRVLGRQGTANAVQGQ